MADHSTTTPAWLPPLRDRFIEILGTLPIGDRVDIVGTADRLVKEVTGEAARNVIVPAVKARTPLDVERVAKILRDTYGVYASPYQGSGFIEVGPSIGGKRVTGVAHSMRSPTVEGFVILPAGTEYAQDLPTVADFGATGESDVAELLWMHATNGNRSGTEERSPSQPLSVEDLEERGYDPTHRGGGKHRG